MLGQTALLTGLLAASMASASDCRCFPGDPCWPSQEDWATHRAAGDDMPRSRVQRNDMPEAPRAMDPSGAPVSLSPMNGRARVPNRAAMTPRRRSWPPGSPTAPAIPSTRNPRPAPWGNYVVYAVDVARPEHVSRTLRFAHDRNIRLSTGAGALAIWTHNLKHIEIQNYRDRHYHGKAIKMGTGVQGVEAYAAADAAGLQVVGGECPSVGIAGRYRQGGGHSALSSRYGLGADQTLAWEVIDGRGNFITATRDNQFSHLYWALSGGGGGTYAIVWSLTSKAHPGSPVSGLNLSYTSHGIARDTFYETLSLWQSVLPAVVDAGAVAVWAFTNTSFTLSPLTGPDIPVADLTALVKPFTDGLSQRGIRYASYAEQFDGYLAQFHRMQAPIKVGVSQYGGWLIPRVVVAANNDGLTATYRRIVEDGATVVGVGVNVSRVGEVDNAVLPAWRQALIHNVVATSWEWDSTARMLAAQRTMTDDYISALRQLAPDSGAYMNEADFRQPDYQRYFFGDHYAALRQIKAKYDPGDVFYAATAVGSDEWTVQGDGRLCRV
ncbi:hypothetical protein BDV28DRAFT_153109 [Aspergillus coremiiformis]|uniref:FAD-binding PCMH-type domain-containing protein n=1 Tax=Aspergillus coremiiformis TaxID=138285 RepID=A0A5N6YU64_9EURO|nr:hypothetical protein BDV28DRAFT_153109 [Aspergillus coremiiformis]